MLNLRHVYYLQSMGRGTSMIGNLGEPLDQRWYSSSGGTLSDPRASSLLSFTTLPESDSRTFVFPGDNLEEDDADQIVQRTDIELQVVRQ